MESVARESYGRLVAYLAAGANSVAVAFDAAAGSANALDLDAITIAPSPDR